MAHKMFSGFFAMPIFSTSSIGHRPAGVRYRRTIRSALVIAALSVSVQPCFAGLDDPIIWLANGVSLKGYTQVVLHPVSNDTGETFDFDVANSITDTMKAELGEAGLEIVAPKEAENTTNAVILRGSMVVYVPGSVGGRWVGFGGGATVCILRTYLLGRDSTETIGEIIVATQVSGGGLFSAGAEKSVPKQAAEQLVEEVVKLVSLEAS